ncbi:hypothetical protein BDN70DRAFT_851201 [Pholiota conissans]|uniref:Uncharacterized protein n=1 Tax=Pholiota conissans TaxID=109636 RepID=A0A9P5ZCW3_9AGAR|nr:hypothetical protein BDN70DRAFT_851201 [Pholiota conissans]
MAANQSPSSAFTIKSLYLAAFAQAGSPHIALLIPESEKSGNLVHIRIQRDISPNWTFQRRTEDIVGNMFLTTLLKIHDVSAGEITPLQLETVSKQVPVPENDKFGECSLWVYRVVEELHNSGMVNLVDIRELGKEFESFAAGNRNFARRDKFPNADVSKWCS